MIWYSHLFYNIPQFVVIHTVKGFSIVSEAEAVFFWNSLAFSMIQGMLAIWSLVPLSFLRSQFFAPGGQSIGASTSVSVLPMNIQDWLPLGLTGLISLQSNGLSRVFSNTTAQKHQFLGTQPSLWSNSDMHTWLLEKPWPESRIDHKMNQDCQEKYQQPQIFRWYHFNGRKWKGIKELFDGSERGEW